MDGAQWPNEATEMRLHRYRPFNPKYLPSEITDGQVYLWRLDRQNDPLEGRVNYGDDAAVTYASIRRFIFVLRGQLRTKTESTADKAWLFGAPLADLAARLESHIEKASDVEIDSLVLHLHSSGAFSDPRKIAGIRAGQARMLSRTVMACFSENEASPVMFAHYAEHTGVSLVYEIDQRDLFKVTYQSELPHLGLMDADPRQIVQARLCTKHTDWSYEREYRLVLYDHEEGLYRNDRMRIAEVMLGHRASHQTEREIKAMAAHSIYSPLEIWRLRPASASYGFERTRVD